jgi:hypothetical protein
MSSLGSLSTSHGCPYKSSKFTYLFIYIYCMYIYMCILYIIYIYYLVIYLCIYAMDSPLASPFVMSTLNRPPLYAANIYHHYQMSRSENTFELTFSSTSSTIPLKSVYDMLYIVQAGIYIHYSIHPFTVKFYHYLCCLNRVKSASFLRRVIKDL